MRELFANHVQTLQPYVPGKPIEEVMREYGLDTCVKLASNENPLGPSPQALEAIQRALNNLSLYPDGSGHYLKQALCKHLDVEQDMLLLGNGSNEIIEMIIRTLMSVPGKTAVTSACSFIVYRLVMQACGSTLREAPMSPGYRYDLDAMAELVDETTQAIFIANPNNPTGTYVTQEQLDRFVDSVDSRFGDDPPVIVLDEAYYEYVEVDDYPDAMALLARRPRTIILRTFSKAYGLAGMRLGYGISHPDMWGYINRIRQPFNVNNLALVGGIAALEDHQFLQKSVALNRVERQFVQDALLERGLDVTPSQTNFLLVDFETDSKELFNALLKLGVIVRPMGGYGLPTSARVSIGTREENVQLIAALDRVLSD